jgi:hypothetical protein
MAIKRKRVSAAERRDQVLAVARQLFARQGFRGTTTRQIADQAQVNEAILFRHFRSKEALYWAVLDDLSRQRNSRGNLQALIDGRVRSTKANADEEYWSERGAIRVCCVCSCSARWSGIHSHRGFSGPIRRCTGIYSRSIFAEECAPENFAT